MLVNTDNQTIVKMKRAYGTLSKLYFMINRIEIRFCKICRAGGYEEFVSAGFSCGELSALPDGLPESGAK